MYVCTLYIEIRARTYIITSWAVIMPWLWAVSTMQCSASFESSYLCFQLYCAYSHLRGFGTTYVERLEGKICDSQFWRELKPWISISRTIYISKLASTFRLCSQFVTSIIIIIRLVLIPIPCDPWLIVESAAAFPLSVIISLQSSCFEVSPTTPLNSILTWHYYL